MKALDRIKVLIVEDNFIVADSLSCLISAYGGSVVAMVPSVVRGLEELSSQPVDVAILDIRVEGGAIELLADRLVQAGVPFVFITGYGDDSILPPRLRGQPRLDKPVDPAQLLKTLQTLLGKN